MCGILPRCKWQYISNGEAEFISVSKICLYMYYFIHIHVNCIVYDIFMIDTSLFNVLINDISSRSIRYDIMHTYLFIYWCTNMCLFIHNISITMTSPRHTFQYTYNHTNNECVLRAVCMCVVCGGCIVVASHDDAIKWKYFPRYWPFVRRIHRSSVNSPHKGQWRGYLMFSLICAWINVWVVRLVIWDRIALIMTSL